MTDWKNRIVGQGEEDPRKIVGNPRNWRIHPLAQGKGLEGVLGEIGWIAPVTINRTTGYCLDGHLRVALAVKRGAKSVPVQYVELSEEEEALALATLDPLGAMAETDAEKLGGLLEQIQTEDAAVQALLDAVAEKAGIEADGAVPEDPGPQVDRADELQEKWRVQRGQVWEIGKHRLMCGDSTSAMDWAALLPPRERERERERVQLAVTSPPYGVGKAYETKGIGPWFDTVRPVIQLLCQHCRVVVWQLVDMYSTGNQFIEPTMAWSIGMFSEQQFKPIWIRVWEKQGINFGVGPYHLVSNKPAQQFEHIMAVAAAEAEAGDVDPMDYEYVTAFGAHQHRFVQRLTPRERRKWGYSGVWKINTVRANDQHPAMFPIELPERCIKMHSDAGDVVIDPFGGSGTTMAACERLGRQGRMIEITPKYCSCALERLALMGLEPRVANS